MDFPIGTELSLDLTLSENGDLPKCLTKLKPFEDIAMNKEVLHMNLVTLAIAESRDFISILYLQRNNNVDKRTFRTKNEERTSILCH